MEAWKSLGAMFFVAASASSKAEDNMSTHLNVEPVIVT
jgi:hypothetical protein